MGTKNNIWLDHLYTPIEFMMLAAVYLVSFQKSLYKYTVVGVVILFIILNFIIVMMGVDITKMNSMPRILESIFLISMAILYFYQTLHNFNYTYLDKDPVFVLSCGVLIYQAGISMAYAMFNDALAESYNTARICLCIVFVLNIFFYAVLTMALKRSPVK
ncbi:hypothetical protein GCM10028895_18440 [Pontibacter rugosus]